MASVGHNSSEESLKSWRKRWKNTALGAVPDDGSGTIEYEEFLKMKAEILKAFRLFDDDETGKISFRNLKRVAKELGERMTDEELQEMSDEAVLDGDGEVIEEELLQPRVGRGSRRRAW